MARLPTARIRTLRRIRVPRRWVIHSYYTLCPYAPDGSGRLLLAGADLERGRACGLIVEADDGATVVARSPEVDTVESFWHTGQWQSWGETSEHVYLQAGSLAEARAARWTVGSDAPLVTVDADLEGMPSTGEPGVSAPHGMLYAAGYADHCYRPHHAPVPFQQRDRHGLSLVSFDPPSLKLELSTAAVLEGHPDRDRLRQADLEIKARFGDDDGLSLMCYCVRWNAQGTRLLFYFGNHNVYRIRDEPRLAYVFTADRRLENLQLAVDLAFGRDGVHWGWHPDGEHLIGYGPDPVSGRTCIAMTHCSGRGYRKIADHDSGGHPSISPTDPDLLVTDDAGELEFINLRTRRTVARSVFPRKGRGATRGRHPGIVDLHPVFRPDGRRVLINTLRDGWGSPVEVSVPGAG